jgi:hypothetical protein
MENIPYYEALVDALYAKQITKGAFNQLMLKDENLREWYQFHRELEKSLKKDSSGYCNKRKSRA